MTDRPGSPAHAFVPFDTGTLFDILIAREAPVMELELLRLLTGRERMPGSKKRLFILHFSLYHALYRLRGEAGARGFYLHLDPMRIRMVKLPGPFRCHHYIPETGTYCAEAAVAHGRCAGHRAEAPGDHPSFDPLRDFYTNPENISFCEGEVLGRLMRGVVVYALRRGEIESALSFLGLRRPNRKRITRRYRELAMAYHPDRNRGDDSMMKELNRSYQVLMEVYVV